MSESIASNVSPFRGGYAGDPVPDDTQDGPGEHDALLAEVLRRATMGVVGRPPKWDLLERLEVLQELEEAHRRGEPLAQAAGRREVQTRTLRRLITWAASSASGAVLFQHIGHPDPKQAMTLTAQGRQVLAHLRRRQHERVKRAADLVIQHDRTPRRGRTSRWTLAARLQMLADVESSRRAGRPLADVAKAHRVNQTLVRDVVLWATTDASGAQLLHRLDDPDPSRAGTFTRVGRYLHHCHVRELRPTWPSGAGSNVTVAEDRASSPSPAHHGRG